MLFHRLLMAPPFSRVLPSFWGEALLLRVLPRGPKLWGPQKSAVPEPRREAWVPFTGGPKGPIPWLKAHALKLRMEWGWEGCQPGPDTWAE